MYRPLAAIQAKTFNNKAKSIEGRLSLTAQFIQGVDICDVAISEGLYSQAAALLKQELETIEAIHEFETGKRREGKTPQLGKLKNFGGVYGRFNQFAHVSVIEMARTLVVSESGELVGASTLPIYNKDIALDFYGMHVYFIIVVAGQIDALLTEVYGEGFNETEQKFLLVALNILK